MVLLVNGRLPTILRDLDGKTATHSSLQFYAFKCSHTLALEVEFLTKQLAPPGIFLDSFWCNFE